MDFHERILSNLRNFEDYVNLACLVQSRIDLRCETPGGCDFRTLLSIESDSNGYKYLTLLDKRFYQVNFIVDKVGEGPITDNKANGWWKFTREGGGIEEGMFVNDKRVGTHTWRHKDGKPFMVDNYDDQDNPHGVHRRYLHNGDFAETVYEAGKLLFPPY